MRIQILPLPTVVVGDVVDEPFAIVVDQCQYDNLNLTPSSIAKAAVERLERFGEECFAAAVLVTDETVEIVDRRAEPAAEPTAYERLRETLDTMPDVLIRAARAREAKAGVRSLMDDLPPEVRPLAVAVGIADRPVDLRERAQEWITGFLAASDDDRVNCVALMLGAADDAIRCAVNHKRDESEDDT